MAEFMTGLKRTHYCGELRSTDIGKEVVVCGWVQRQRDLGQLIFIDLRDRTGIVQLAFDESTDRAIFEKAFAARAEFVLLARGTGARAHVQEPGPAHRRHRDGGRWNCACWQSRRPRRLKSWRTPTSRRIPRLKYRYLDLRRPDMQRKIIGRHKIVKVAHDYFDQNGFIEIETPDLIKSTPEGARDYLVPCRVFPGSFFALPQSPQLYKQLLMLSGFDRYMQIARCFRDEDLRADRQPEFTQIDLEMSFVDQDDVMAIGEGFMKRVYKEVLGIDIETPLPPHDLARGDGPLRFRQAGSALWDGVNQLERFAPE